MINKEKVIELAENSDGFMLFNNELWSRFREEVDMYSEIEKLIAMVVAECVDAVSVIDIAQTKDREFVDPKELIKEKFGIKE